MHQYRGFPGPWKAVHTEAGRIKVVAENGMTVCHFNYAPTKSVEHSQLIAEAPNFLEELHETDKTLCALQGNIADANKTDSRWDGMWDEIQQRRDAINAAIDAATKQP